MRKLFAAAALTGSLAGLALFAGLPAETLAADAPANA